MFEKDKNPLVSLAKDAMKQSQKLDSKDRRKIKNLNIKNNKGSKTNPALLEMNLKESIQMTGVKTSLRL